MGYGRDLAGGLSSGTRAAVELISYLVSLDVSCDARAIDRTRFMADTNTPERQAAGGRP